MDDLSKTLGAAEGTGRVRSERKPLFQASPLSQTP